MAVSSLVPAASGPTLAEIQTAVSTYSTPYNGTWTELGATTFTSSSTTTISGLSGYKQIKIYLFTAPSTAAELRMRLNSDTGSNYGWQFATPTNNSYNYPDNKMTLGTNSGNNNATVLTISPANSTTAKKVITSESHHTNGTIASFNGLWNSSSAITSVTFFLTAGLFSPGYAVIWGIN